MSAVAAPEAPPRASNPFSRLYRGETSYDFVGRRKIWFSISIAIIAIGMISIATRGLNFGIDFKGGVAWEVSAPSLSATQVQDTMGSVGLSSATVQVLGSGSHRTIEVQDNLNTLSAAAKTAKEQQVSQKLASLANVPASQVSLSDVGPTWGGDITSKAVRALIVFLVAIALYITVRFEWKMAIAALIAVAHDILLTAGIYSLSGFQVTPATVIAFLTVLGYSLYDTIVVFDRVQENAKTVGPSGRYTYTDMVNLSMNQTLARSVNTTLVAVLPILSVLVIGAQILGATTLQEFGLALFIGLTSGAYSSLFIASPLLAMLKEREERYATIRHRLESRGEALAVLTPAAAASSGLAVAGGTGGRLAGSSGGRVGGNGARSGDGVSGERPSDRRVPGRPPPMRGGTRRPPPRPRKKGKRR